VYARHAHRLNNDARVSSIVVLHPLQSGFRGRLKVTSPFASRPDPVNDTAGGLDQPASASHSALASDRR
jgi:hypothetical protein